MVALRRAQPYLTRSDASGTRYWTQLDANRSRFFSVRVTDDKAAKWLHDVQEALRAGRLSSGQAAKLAGRLSFSAQHTFRKLGRAMLRPLFQQEHKPLPNGRLGPQLRLALQWWEQVLALKITQRAPAETHSEVV